MEINNRLELTVNVSKFADAIGVNLGKVVEKISFDLHGKITKKTPVKTGRARASFDVAIGAPPTTVPAERAAGDETIIPQPPFNANGEISGKESVFIVSNLDYIEELENGSSSQSPAGMLRVGMAETVAELDSILAEFDEK